MVVLQAGVGFFLVSNNSHACRYDLVKTNFQRS